MTELPLPLKCMKCHQPFMHAISAERLAELERAGVPAFDIAKSFSDALRSWELLCPACRATSSN